MNKQRVQVLYLIATTMTSVAACAIGIILRRRSRARAESAEQMAFEHALHTLEGEGGLVLT